MFVTTMELIRIKTDRFHISVNLRILTLKTQFPVYINIVIAIHDNLTGDTFVLLHGRVHYIPSQTKEVGTIVVHHTLET